MKKQSTVQNTLRGLLLSLFTAVSLFLNLAPGAYAARCVSVMSAIEVIQNKQRDIPTMIEELKTIVLSSESTQAEQELAIKFLTTIASKKEDYFQAVHLIVSDALLKNDVSIQKPLLEAITKMTLQTTNKDLAHQSIDKWNKIIAKLKDPNITVLTWGSFKLSEKYPEKFLSTFQNVAKIMTQNGGQLLPSQEDYFVFCSMQAILKLPENYQKEITVFLQNNVNDMKYSEALRQIYFKVYGEIGNKILQQILIESK